MSNAHHVWLQRQVQDALLDCSDLGGDIALGDERFLARIAAAISATAHAATNKHLMADEYNLNVYDAVKAGLMALRGVA